MIWSKAIKDSSGLRSFYEKIKTHGNIPTELRLKSIHPLIKKQPKRFINC